MYAKTEAGQRWEDVQARHACQRADAYNCWTIREYGRVDARRTFLDAHNICRCQCHDASAQSGGEAPSGG